jgi:hypothetical protein
MAETVTCLDCGMVNPPPEQTCTGTRERGFPRDHFVGDDVGCWNCGRRREACRRRPCSARRAARYEAEEGGEPGNG